MKQKTSTRHCQDMFSGDIGISFRSAVKILSSYPSSSAAFLKLAATLKSAEKRRNANGEEGIGVPPLMIVSTTQACNLACAGCYSCAHNREESKELSVERISSLLEEASGLGVSVVMLAGGEPLLSHGWLEEMSKHEEMAGLVFSNGTLFDENRIKWFGSHRHMIPTLSIEGDEHQTDSRRGAGVHLTVTNTMEKLKKASIPFGVSITVTSENIDEILCSQFVEEYIEKGCRLFIFVEYVPVSPGSEPLVLSMEEKQRLSVFASSCAAQYPALFIPFPGDESQYDGCLAAGRGFIHISASGDVEPCPFAPFSDKNLKSATLKDALSSSFLQKVRENHHLLKEGDGGCALWSNREWLKGLS